MHHITPIRVLGVLGFYALIFIVMRLTKKRVDPIEKKTFLWIGAVWAISVFIANYLLYLAGAMSFLPWVNNFMHTFIWIGFCLTWFYLGVRETEPMWAQCAMFGFFSLIVKYAEQRLFGTWDMDHFFVSWLHGNGAYIGGWSLADATYPILTLFTLRLVARRVPGLIAT
ncbi:MAG TPA: hypothetical protein VLJ80_15150 [Solirubrobacteraceae bacterium]|nr:hypothetical protein [Solirubrobacteraceae bacterium]